METTVVILKPDAYARGLLGELTGALERRGLILVGCKLARLSNELLWEHYAHLADKPFFPRIVAFMQSTPVLIQAWSGVDAVKVVRDAAGVTNGREAGPGSLRGQLSVSVQCNLLHASDSHESAAAELGRFFGDGEVFDAQHPLVDYLYAEGEADG